MSFSHAEGRWGAKSVGIVLTRELEFLAIRKMGGKHFHPLKGKHKKLYPVFWGVGGGTQTGLEPRFSYFVAPPPLQ